MNTILPAVLVITLLAVGCNSGQLTYRNTSSASLQTPTKVHAVTISTRQPLTMNKGTYSHISFDAQPVSPATQYRFTENGGIPGMIFENNLCNNNPAWNNKGGTTACLAEYAGNSNSGYGIYLDGIPTATGKYGILITATDQAGNTAARQFTITVTGSITITNVSPSSGPTGTQVTITGGGFTPIDNALMIEFNGYFGHPFTRTFPDSKTIQFAIPSSLSKLCPGIVGPDISVHSSAGCGSINVVSGDSLSISVMNGLGSVSNLVTFTVTSP